MKSLGDRVVDVLRWSQDEWLSAVDVCRRLGMNTAAGGDRYIDAVAHELCTAVDAGMARMRLPGGDVFQSRYQISEGS